MNGEILPRSVKIIKTRLGCYVSGVDQAIMKTLIVQTKGSINMLDVEEQDEAVVAITQAQMKKATYPYPCTEKEQLQEAKVEVEQAMSKE